MRNFIITLTLLFCAVVVKASAQEITVIDGKSYTIYKIEKGDTIYSLAREYGTTVEEIRAANPELSEILSVGQKLRIPMKSKSAKAEKPAKEAKHAKEIKPVKEPKHAKEPAPAAVAPVEVEITVAASIAENENVAPVIDEKRLHTLVERATALLEQLLQNEPSIDSDTTTQTVVEAKKRFRVLPRSEKAEVALLLPLGLVDKPGKRYIEFYRGFLMGLDSVRLSGYSVNINLYNTARDSVRLTEIIASGALDSVDLVIGPVYEEEIKPVVASLEGKDIPMVSPLATLTGINSDFLFQMAPSQESRMDKFRHLLDGSRRVVIISTNNVDAKLDAAVRSTLPNDVKVIEKRYIAETPAKVAPNVAELVSLLRGEDQPVVIVTSNNETEVIRILNALCSAKASLTTRANNGEPFIIIGNNSWSRFKNMDKDILYKSGVNMVSSYYYDDENPAIEAFGKRYLTLYGDFPSLYSYRGFDTAIIFIRALYNEKMGVGLEGEHFVPMCIPYLFKTDSKTGVRVNQEWIKERYNSDHTISFE